ALVEGDVQPGVLPFEAPFPGHRLDPEATLLLLARPFRFTGAAPGADQVVEATQRFLRSRFVGGPDALRKECNKRKGQQTYVDVLHSGFLSSIGVPADTCPEDPTRKVPQGVEGPFFRATKRHKITFCRDVSF